MATTSSTQASTLNQTAPSAASETNIESDQDYAVRRVIELVAGHESSAAPDARAKTIGIIVRALEEHDRLEVIAAQEVMAAKALDSLIAAYEEILAHERGKDGKKPLSPKQEESVIRERMFEGGFPISDEELAALSVSTEDLRMRPSGASAGSVDVATKTLGQILPSMMRRRFREEAEFFSEYDGVPQATQPVLLAGPQGHLGSGIMKRIRKRQLQPAQPIDWTEARENGG